MLLEEVLSGISIHPLIAFEHLSLYICTKTFRHCDCIFKIQILLSENTYALGNCCRYGKHWETSAMIIFTKEHTEQYWKVPMTAPSSNLASNNWQQWTTMDNYGQQWITIDSAMFCCWKSLPSVLVWLQSDRNKIFNGKFHGKSWIVSCLGTEQSCRLYSEVFLKLKDTFQNLKIQNLKILFNT